MEMQMLTLEAGNDAFDFKDFQEDAKMSEESDDGGEHKYRKFNK
jgi:hypothetical protein